MKVSKKVLLFLSSIILLIIFTEFSLFIKHGNLNQFDFDTTVKLQDHLPHKLEKAFFYFSILGSVNITILGWLVLFIYSLIKKHWLIAVSLFLFFGSVLAELFGKVIVNQPSPPFMFYKSQFSEFQFAESYIQSQHSYPSGHMIRTTFLALVVFFIFIKKGSLFKKLIGFLGLISFIFVMGISRVYLGEHWSSDVIGGVILGLALGVLSGITII